MKTKLVQYSQDVIEHRKEQLISSVNELFCACDIAFITDHLRDLLFFALNPEEAKNLKKENVVLMVNNQLNLILCLTKLLVALQDYLAASGLSTEDLDQP